MKIPKGSDVKWLTREAKRVAKAMLASGDNDPAEALEWTYRLPSLASRTLALQPTI